jgi:hypothetical protein
LSKEETKEIIDILYKCPKASVDVHLKVKNKYTKGFLGLKKIISQDVKKCDLQSQGGCTVKLEPAYESKCPAVQKALKSSLK